MRTFKLICEPAAAEEVDPLLKLYYAIRDQGVLANPFAFLGSKEWGSSPVIITPGVPQMVFKHTGSHPMLLVIQAMGSANANRNYLMMSPTEVGCTISLAKRFDFDTAPKLSVVLGPNEEAWVDVTDPDGGAAEQTINFSIVPLHDVMRDF